jgi:hypothetical protein
MTVVVQSIPSGSRLYDTIAPYTPTTLAALKSAGADGVIGYYGGNLTTDAVAAAHAIGLGVVGVSYSRAPGWTPTAVLGRLDAVATLAHLALLALPRSTAGLLMRDWADVEGVLTGVDPTPYLDARAAAIVAGGLLAGIYVGAAAGLAAAPLYALPQVTGYWRSGSDVPTPACEWMLTQCRPLDQTRAGIDVDVDFAEHDLRGRSATWWVQI